MDKPASASVKVRATQVGYYGEARRRVGDVFTLEDPKHFSAKWMERVDASTPEKITTGNEDLRRQHDEMLGRTGGKPTGAQGVLGDDE